MSRPVGGVAATVLIGFALAGALAGCGGGTPGGCSGCGRKTTSLTGTLSITLVGGVPVPTAISPATVVGDVVTLPVRETVNANGTPPLLAVDGGLVFGTGSSEIRVDQLGGTPFALSGRVRSDAGTQRTALVSLRYDTSGGDGFLAADDQREPVVVTPSTALAALLGAAAPATLGSGTLTLHS